MVKGTLACAFILMALVNLATLGCGDSAASDVDSGKLRVVSTVSPITSLVENIGGTAIELQGIVPEGVNSHTFEPAPSVAKVLASADLIVLNGLFLEEPSLNMAEAAKRSDAIILTLGDKAITPEEWVFDFSFPETDGYPNPHLWTNPILALKYAELIRDELAALDEAHSDYYHENYSKLETRIQDLDRRITEAVATVPAEDRRLLTYHDSFPYFAQRYGMEIIGAIQPSDFSQPSARQVARLIEQIRDSGVPAIFGSEVFSSDILEQIAEASGAAFVDELRDDDLPGGPGGPDHSYLGLMQRNMETMIPALGGSVTAMEGFDAGPVFEGASNAVYPQ